MSINVTRIEDNSDGFTVDFTVVNTYRRTFEVRPEGTDQMVYARNCVKSIVNSPVEKPEGVIVKTPPVIAQDAPEPPIDLTPPAPPVAPPAPPAEPPAPPQP